MPPKPPDPQDLPAFEQALIDLERIARQLEDGEVGLSEALARYEQGIKLLKQCYGWLEQAERKIELLTGVDAQGNPITQPFNDPGSDDLGAKSSTRSRRRSAGTSGKVTPPPEDAADEIDEPGGLF